MVVFGSENRVLVGDGVRFVLVFFVEKDDDDAEMVDPIRLANHEGSRTNIKPSL